MGLWMCVSLPYPQPIPAGAGLDTPQQSSLVSNKRSSSSTYEVAIVSQAETARQTKLPSFSFNCHNERLEVGSINMPSLQMRKLRPRKVKMHSQKVEARPLAPQP